MSTTSSISDDDGSYYSNPKRPSPRPWMGLCLVNCLRALRRPRTRSLCFFVIVSIPAILGISFYLELLPGPQWLPSLSSSPTNDIGILGNGSGSSNEESSANTSSPQSNGDVNGNGAPTGAGGNNAGSNGGNNNNNNFQNIVGPNRPKSFDIASCGETSFLESSESTNNSSSSSNTTLDDNKDSFEYFCSWDTTLQGCYSLLQQDLNKQTSWVFLGDDIHGMSQLSYYVSKQWPYPGQPKTHSRRRSCENVEYYGFLPRPA